MAEGERERVVATLMDVGTHEQPSVLATLAGMPLMAGDSPLDPDRFPYLSQQAFYVPAEPGTARAEGRLGSFGPHDAGAAKAHVVRATTLLMLDVKTGSVSLYVPFL